MLAPMFGQLVLVFFGWHAIYLAIALIGLVSLLWFLLRQAETLDKENRQTFSIVGYWQMAKQVFTNKKAMGYTLAAGIMSGPFVFYLSSAQQLFQLEYQLGDYFVIYFAVLAFSIGIASFVNGKLVMQVGMRPMVNRALIVTLVVSVLFAALSTFYQGLPALWKTSIYLLLVFFCLGILFGNMNALAMEPLGKVAGFGAAIVGFVSTMLSALLAQYIGTFFQSGVMPLVVSFCIASSVSLVVIWLINFYEAIDS